jgi:hypothetical protein
MAHHTLPDGLLDIIRVKSLLEPLLMFFVPTFSRFWKKLNLKIAL